MPATNKERLDYALDNETHYQIKYNVVENFDRYDSVADFTRLAIRDHHDEIHELSLGGKEANKLIRALCRIDGFDESESQALKPSSVIQFNFGKSRTVTLTQKDVGWLNDIQDETNLKHSYIAQYSIFKELAETGYQHDVLDSGAEKDIIRAWAELKKSLIDPRINLHHVLAKWFAQSGETVRYFLENDIQRFDDFAGVYEQDFYQTESYDHLQEMFGDSVMNNVENLIEEYTDYSFPKRHSTGFLDDIPENLE